MGENPQPFSQLQCSRKSPGIHQLNQHEKSISIAAFRFRTPLKRDVNQAGNI